MTARPHQERAAELVAITGVDGHADAIAAIAAALDEAEGRGRAEAYAHRFDLGMRHRRTDPACSRHRRPSGRLSTWWFDRHRGRMCPPCGAARLAAYSETDR